MHFGVNHIVVILYECVDSNKTVYVTALWCLLLLACFNCNLKFDLYTWKALITKIFKWCQLLSSHLDIHLNSDMIHSSTKSLNV